ncbi:Tfp pilus assembly protein PilF [Fontimonas thermophila]|uniref:Tfp pilus assembly protein PilF n=1 Tax=Fontimonas thermophila TaxID=1076937 RepID=A0A1I2KQ73_9GAMM|nr:sulfotransferase family protein [Fontimonas thermophila]SFF68673.1 Tfp pilus assembly protein PilF [Fontimonas thermophila]
MNGISIEESRRNLDVAFRELKAGRLNEARVAFTRLCNDPGCGADAYRGLAAICWRQGQMATAIEYLRQAVSLAPDHPDAHADLAFVLMAARQLAAALPHMERLVALQPHNPDAWHNLGKLLGDLRELESARQAFERSLQLAPDRRPTLVTYARTLAACGDDEGAERIWERIIALQPNIAEGYQGLAEVQFARGHLHRCLETYRRGVQAVPDSPEMHMGLAQLTEDLGDREGAERSFRQALALRPDWPIALEGLLTLIRDRAEPELLTRARAIVEDPRRPPQDRANVGFGLGKALDARDPDAAFAIWTLANRARREQIGPYDRDRLTRRIDRTIAAFSDAQYERLRNAGDPDPRPVFVIGMPRSGTTLVEQIIAAHPQAHGYGELPEIGRIARELPRRAGSIQKWPEVLSVVDEQVLKSAAADYLANLVRREPSSAMRWIDKAPLNFFYAGLIALMFPRATIIWCRRDPRDVCVSIYGENFSLDQGFATDLADLGYFYREHMRLMRHWCRLFGERIYECVYEDLVAAPEAGTRRLIDVVGLPWDDACLAFHRNDRAVLTPSRWQVRQPMYAQSVGRWRRYARHIGPLLEALGDEAPA